MKSLEHGPLSEKTNRIHKRNTKKRKLLNRLLRHIGIPDHGGIQRLIATGGIAASLDAVPDRFGFTDSIDVVFPVYWMYPAKVRALSAKDIECVKRYRQLAKQGKLIWSSHSTCFISKPIKTYQYLQFTAFILSKGFFLNREEITSMTCS